MVGWPDPQSGRSYQPKAEEATYDAKLATVLDGHGAQSALVYGFQRVFLTGDDYRCDQFTITDAHSRFLIRCQVVARMDFAQVNAVCDAAMREYGMPERIRMDNGAPFAGLCLLGLSKLSLGWMKLGIVHEHVQPGRPQQNGRHERMHRTLKEEASPKKDRPTPERAVGGLGVAKKATWMSRKSFYPA